VADAGGYENDISFANLISLGFNQIGDRRHTLAVRQLIIGVAVERDREIRIDHIPHDHEILLSELDILIDVGRERLIVGDPVVFMKICTGQVTAVILLHNSLKLLYCDHRNAFLLLGIYLMEFLLLL
jgi:hypothetical protein